ncbi:hypothetical protein B0T26DRAFT_673807 [Lasiosphaeria miniovina]|uniref:Uncharacterized protein n=1 Tax=Lasiosphaeria miniovina TaxID=1954250 RepID=A0AA40AU47_9PEZI|nr:uncharacterized protein B0T26DRAFT_673807 [Lasiosphaeria miniovina]KAK0722055.1 hypothetical protein B0T26DRAFT_673807 [Lasiosphaeria miniovina]
MAKPAHMSMGAYWANPEDYDSADAYVRARNDQLDVYGVLMDPFTPLHTYSGVLPVRELTLPPWTWQGAMAKMKAFFHAGPLLLTGDVPEILVPGRELTSDAVVLPEIDDKIKPIGLPAVASGDWAWLQPYEPAEEEEKLTGVHRGIGLSEEEARERFMPLPVKAEDERARFDEGLYTAVEGYVMMVGRKEDKS